MAISTFYMMGFQKRSRNILETFFLRIIDVTYILPKIVVKPTLRFSSQSVSIHSLLYDKFCVKKNNKKINKRKNKQNYKKTVLNN